MEYIQWIFSGIGTQILSVIGGLVIGGVVGYKVRDKQIGKQQQKGGASSNQRQEFYIDDPMNLLSGEAKNEHQIQNSIIQIQKAGDNSEQIQIGGKGKRGR